MTGGAPAGLLGLYAYKDIGHNRYQPWLLRDHRAALFFACWKDPRPRGRRDTASVTHFPPLPFRKHVSTAGRLLVPLHRKPVTDRRSPRPNRSSAALTQILTHPRRLIDHLPSLRTLVNHPGPLAQLTL